MTSAAWPSPAPAGTPGFLAPGSDPGVLPGPVLVADKGNDRLLVLSPQGQVLWQWPRPGDLAPGQTFRVPDDAFMTPDGKDIIATQEDDFVVTEIDVATGRIVWRYGAPGLPGSGPGRLDNPDDAMRLPDGTVIAADIKNCRLVELSPSFPRPVWSLGGGPGTCRHDPPARFGSPNGVFPLPDGHVLVTEINGDWVDEMDRAGHLYWSAHPPGVAYPSDSSQYRPGQYVTADYSDPGQVVVFDARGHLLWRWAPSSGAGRLDRPSLAEGLPNGDILLNDDGNDRVIVLDPARNRIRLAVRPHRSPGRGAGLPEHARRAGPGPPELLRRPRRPRVGRGRLLVARPSALCRRVGSPDDEDQQREPGDPEDEVEDTPQARVALHQAQHAQDGQSYGDDHVRRRDDGMAPPHAPVAEGPGARRRVDHLAEERAALHPGRRQRALAPHRRCPLPSPAQDGRRPGAASHPGKRRYHRTRPKALLRGDGETGPKITSPPVAAAVKLLVGEAMPRIAQVVPALIGAVLTGVALAAAPAGAAIGSTLTLDRTEASALDQVTATGTCAPVVEFPPSSVTVAFDGTPVGTSPVDVRSGAFGPVTFSVPAGAAPGSHTVTTDCGGSEDLRVDAAQPTLSLDPPEARVLDTVTATGACVLSGEFPPTTVDVAFDGTPVGTFPMDVTTGAFGPASFSVPDGEAPGSHTVTTNCDGSAPFVVDPPIVATLALDHTEVTAPVQVAATGTCPPGGDLQLGVALDGAAVGSSAVDPTTGTFGPVSFTVPAGTEPGSHRVTSDCGGSATLVVDALTATSTTPPTSTPTSSTSSRTTAAPTTAGPSTSAAPQPSPSPPISASGGPPAPAASSGPLWPILGLLAVAALVATALKALRDGRGRRWVTGHVELRPATGEALVPDRTGEQEVRSDSVRLHVHEEPGWTTGLEVKDADHRADPADDGP